MKYKIKSLTEKDFESGRYLYWSNEFGWTKKKYADTFTEEDVKKLNLPTWSIWEKENDKYTDKQIKKLWKDFEAIHFDNDDKSDKQFLHFPKGTNKFDIWHWFDDNYSKGLAKGLMGLK